MSLSGQPTEAAQPKPVKQCWAAVAGGCGGGLSGEHIISKSQFNGSSKIRVVGLPWCKDAPKDVGLSSLTANILCRDHNTALSPVDTSAAITTSTLRMTLAIHHQRQQGGNGKPPWRVYTHTVDGWALERWMLKTVINLTYRGRFPVGDRSLAPGQISPTLVRAALGQERLPGHAGLYAIAAVGATLAEFGPFSYTTIVQDQSFVAGAFVQFRGFQFLLSLIPEALPDAIDRIRDGGRADATLMHRIRKFAVNLGGFRSQVIRFSW